MLAEFELRTDNQSRRAPASGPRRGGPGDDVRRAAGHRTRTWRAAVRVAHGYFGRAAGRPGQVRPGRQRGALARLRITWPQPSHAPTNLAFAGSANPALAVVATRPGSGSSNRAHSWGVRRARAPRPGDRGRTSCDALRRPHPHRHRRSTGDLGAGIIQAFLDAGARVKGGTSAERGLAGTNAPTASPRTRSILPTSNRLGRARARGHKNVRASARARELRRNDARMPAVEVTRYVERTFAVNARAPMPRCSRSFPTSPSTGRRHRNIASANAFKNESPKRRTTRRRPPSSR